MPSSTLNSERLRDLSPQSPGSQSTLRRHNELRIREQLTHGPQTQAMLVRATGLSAGTVSNIVKNLVSEGEAHTEPTTSSGRKALNIVLTTRTFAGLGIDFGLTELRMAIAVPGNTIVAEATRTIPEGQSAAQAIDLAHRMFNDLLNDHEIGRDTVTTAGISIAAPIDQRTGLPASETILPQWAGIDIAKAVGKKLKLHTIVDNDANLAALAESFWGSSPGADHMLYIKLDNGIGAGLIFDGRLHYGHIGITGEIGHATLDDSGLPCRCGNRGCLETQASTRIMLERLRDTPESPNTVEEIISLALAGNHATLRVIEDTGLAIGRVLGFISSLINPELIVIGGPLAPLGDLLLTPVLRGHSRYTTPMIVETTRIVTGSLGARSEVLGAAALALDHAQRNSAPSTTGTRQG